eukprot:8947264-Ditylum_brightwellii.AAC.1
MEKKFLTYHLEDNKDLFPVFYLLAKVHKDPWKTRPIVSCPGSLLYKLGIWTDFYLKQIAQDMPTYLHDSTTLKEKVTNLTFPPGCTLLTADITLMYTNIKTAPVLNEMK